MRHRSVTGWPGRQKCVRVRVGIGAGVCGGNGGVQTHSTVSSSSEECPVYHLSQVKACQARLSTLAAKTSPAHHPKLTKSARRGARTARAERRASRLSPTSLSQTKPD